MPEPFLSLDLANNLVINDVLVPSMDISGGSEKIPYTILKENNLYDVLVLQNFFFFFFLVSPVIKYNTGLYPNKYNYANMPILTYLANNN
jgi:hypothetical protein